MGVRIMVFFFLMYCFCEIIGNLPELRQKGVEGICFVWSNKYLVWEILFLCLIGSQMKFPSYVVRWCV